MNVHAQDANLGAKQPFLPIIVAPERQSKTQRTLGQALTLGFWLFWVYLWLPLISLLAWLFGFQLFYERIFVQQGFQRLLDILPVAAAGVLILSGGLLIWAVYNYLKFRHRHRRTHVERVEPNEIALHFGMDSTVLAQDRESRLLLVRHDDEGNPVGSMAFTPGDRTG